MSQFKGNFECNLWQLQGLDAQNIPIKIWVVKYIYIYDMILFKNYFTSYVVGGQ